MSPQESHFLAHSRGHLIYTRELMVRAGADRVYAITERLGGRRGWLFANFLWQLRGAMDRALGGVGMGRPRRDPDTLRAGDVLDFWRVEEVEPEKVIRLRGEMKLPGKAWLQFEFHPMPSGILLRSQAVFKPDGVWGYIYWGALYPAHVFLFSGLLRAIARESELHGEPARVSADTDARN